MGRKELNGLAIGGPYDGRMLSNTAPQYNVGINPEPPLKYLSPRGDEAKANVKMDVFTYVYYDYIAFTPVWIPLEVMEGKMFDYHHYDHPMEYVMKKLVDGYNPIAKR